MERRRTEAKTESLLLHVFVFFFFFCPANIGRQFTVFTSGQQNNNNKINVVLVAAESEEIIHSARDFVHTHAGHENTPFAVP